MKRLAIVTTHPIQYNAPVFRLLQERNKVHVRVFYTSGKEFARGKFDIGFGKQIEWDIPLTEGYDFEFLENVSTAPGSHHYKGIDNPELIKKIEAWGADTVLIFGWRLKSHLKVLRHFRGEKPVLFRGDSTLLDERPGFKAGVRRAILSWVYRHVDIALYAGSANYVYYIAHGLKPEQLVYAPHAVENERFIQLDSAQVKELQAWKNELAIGDEIFPILFAGKMIPKKNPGFIVALSKLLPDPRLRFLFAGQGELLEALKTEVAHDKRFIFIGFQNQTKMPLLYRLANVFVLPSYGPGETWGLAVNEAMCCGLPVIVSNKCGCAEDLVANSHNGLVCSPDDVESAARYIEKLLDNPSVYRSSSNAAVEHIKSFNFAAIAAAIEGACIYNKT